MEAADFDELKKIRVFGVLQLMLLILSASRFDGHAVGEHEISLKVLWQQLSSGRETPQRETTVTFRGARTAAARPPPWAACRRRGRARAGGRRALHEAVQLRQPLTRALRLASRSARTCVGMHSLRAANERASSWQPPRLHQDLKSVTVIHYGCLWTF